MVKIQHTLHTLPWASAEGGGGENRRPPSSSKIKQFVLLYGWPFSYFFSRPMWRPFCYVFPLMGDPFHHVRAFLLPFSPRGDLSATFFYLWGAFLHVRAFLPPFSPCGGLFCSHEGAFYGRAPMHIQSTEHFVDIRL